ncbi:dihydrodipicolinate synthase family protein [Microbacterium capsulatum]|uniref:Dihydrodipicolinate synthase family protein n=1 Tax=Microbacterium capsulatum TaxID=3041921 RepID=A0ABU0XEG0_9MICO|nr:dihydrodipicolinate synthase family protein [Microbacterium sp. ASV81]MDQ4213506.1 dihydrodipicolinate synthase family protein [Microbacterium sp. ASV81]
MTAPEILSAIPTPFTAAGELDLPAFRENLDRLVGSVDGVFVAGTTGEFPALEDTERLVLIDAALAVFGPNRVVAHVGAASTRQAAGLLRSAITLGATRCAAITPYFLAASTAGVATYYRQLKDIAGERALYAYVFPEVAGTDVHPEDLGALVDAGIDGIKVSGLASTRVREYLATAPEGFALWSGNDADLPAVLAAGGRGTVSGVSAVCPRPWAAYRDAETAGDAAARDDAQRRIATLVPLLGPSIAALKLGLDHLGLTGGSVRMSIDTPAADRAEQIRSAIDSAA